MMRNTDTILVTGAAGFIGSAVAARLASTGSRVIGCDNFNDYYDHVLKHDRVRSLLKPNGVECLRVDLAEAEQVVELFERYRPDHVIHLAAQAGVRYSLQNPSAYIQSNLVAFGHVLQSCRHHKIRHLVYASSSSVYGANKNLPFRETDRTDAPVSLYAATKKANELMAHTYSHLYDLPATGLRFFTVYGPWGRPDMAYFSFTQKIIAGETIPVFSEGELLRDFTYIDDIVEGVVRVLARPPVSVENSAAHAIFNIGNHQPIRVRDFIRTLEHVLGLCARMEFLPMQPGDVTATFSDTSALREWTGFSPATTLEDGLIRFTKWYEEWTKSRSAPNVFAV